NGECYPSVRLISKDLSLSKSSVFRAFNELERNGLLQRLPRYHPSGARRSTLYALLAVGICLSANEVPRIAQMFGLDTSVRFNMISVSSTVSLGSRVAKAFTKK
ncbi:MAG: DUF6045 family protein, partial [Ruminococcus sp.]|nr:DUF6045 family protein [Ruminococcus sp.]